MAAHSSPVSPVWFHYNLMLVILCSKNVLKGPKLDLTYMLCVCWILRMKYHSLGNIKTERTWKAASKAFNIMDVSNSICCHGNKTAKLVLWSACSRILLQRIRHLWCKLAEICSYHSWSKFGWVYDIVTWLIYIFQKLRYLWNKNRSLKMVDSLLLLVQTTCLCFKMA